MSKSKRVKIAEPQVSKDSASRRRIARGMLHLLGILIFVGGIGYTTLQTKKYIDQEVGAPTGPLKIALVNKPAWMSDFLAAQIAVTIPRLSSSAFDHDLLIKAVAKLEKNPWVRTVHQVRRVYGERPGDTLEVDCEFRTPIALVHSGDFYWLVDNDGVKLPEQFTADLLPKVTVGPDGRTNIRIIEGVRQPPPPAGLVWTGQDLVAGLDLVKLFYGKLYLDEVTSVDVSNFAGRVKRADPQMVLLTRYDTQVWWGRPVNAKDFFVEVPVSRKLQILRATVQQRGRIDAGKSYVDVRYEDYLVPADSPPNIEAGTGEGGNR